MKFNIDCFVAELDFKYEKVNNTTIATLCQYNDGVNILLSSVRCDIEKHNRFFARKYAIEKTIKSLSKPLRTKIWKAYWDYTKSEKQKDAYLAIDDFLFQNVDGEIFIGNKNESISLTEEQRNILIKLLK